VHWTAIALSSQLGPRSSVAIAARLWSAAAASLCAASRGRFANNIRPLRRCADAAGTPTRRSHSHAVLPLLRCAAQEPRPLDQRIAPPSDLCTRHRATVSDS